MAAAAVALRSDLAERATGGTGGAVVTARTGAEINAALCARASVSTPLIIRVDGTITHANTTKATGSCDTTATEIQFKGVSNVTLIGVANQRRAGSDRHSPAQLPRTSSSRT